MGVFFGDGGRFLRYERKELRTPANAPEALASVSFLSSVFPDREQNDKVGVHICIMESPGSAGG